MNHIHKITDLRSGTEQAGILWFAETRDVRGRIIDKRRVRHVSAPNSDLEDKVTGYGTTVALSVALLALVAMIVL